MAPRVIPCDSCGSPIPDSDLETGAAVTLLGKRYCGACKTEAIQSVSLEDLSGSGAPPKAPSRPAPPKAAAKPPAPKSAPARSAPAAAPTPPERPAGKSPPPRTPAVRPERKAASRRAAAPASSRKPLLIAGGAVAAILVAVAAFVVFKGDAPPKTDPRETGKSGAPEGPAVSGPDRETQARAAYAKVEEIAGRAGASWDLVLAAADKARPACRGTAWEKRLEDLRSRAAQEKETEDAAREISPLLDELKGAVATDPEFKRYPELQPKFQLALEMASKTGSVKRDEIRALQREYNGKYEKLAEPHYTEINEAAVQLAEEKRYDDALRKISTFPQHLRHSGAWMSLDKLRQDIERRRKK